MNADEINTLALVLAKTLAQNCSKQQLSEICTLLSQTVCNISVYIKQSNNPK